MTVSLIPASTFGRHALTRLFQTDGTALQVQLLNVPTSEPGDRTTWTWDSHWKNYAVAGAFSGSGGLLDLRTTGTAPPSSIALYEETTMVYTGAYYDGLYVEDDRYVLVYNSSGSAITFTHFAVFAAQPAANALAELNDANTYCLFVSAENADEDPATLAALSYAFIAFGIYGSSFLGGAVLTSTPSLQEWVDNVVLTPQDQPFPLVTSYTKHYPINKEQTPFVEPAYKTIVASTSTATQSYILGELLNVTGAVPAFDEGWSAWETYRIKRYAVSPLNFIFDYTAESEYIDIVVDGDTYRTTVSGNKLSPVAPADLHFTAPSSGSYTYTHIALFINETSTPPPPNSTYVYTDTDKFMGVIELASSVTMTTASTARAYPVIVSLLYEPQIEIELLP